jgi:hypothetical protein
MTGHDRYETAALRTETVRARSWLLRAVGGKFGYLLGALIAPLLTAPLIVRGWA